MQYLPADAVVVPLAVQLHQYHDGGEHEHAQSGETGHQDKSVGAGPLPAVRLREVVVGGEGPPPVGVFRDRGAGVHACLRDTAYFENFSLNI